MIPHLGLMFLIELSAVFSETGLHHRAIKVVPNVTVALINDSTYFNCSTTLKQVEWHYTSDENEPQSVIYSYGTVKTLYQDRFLLEKYVNETEKQFNLVLQSVTKDDSGQYFCRDSESGKEEGEVQLIVLETEPECELNLIGPNSCAMKPESVQLSCSVRYSGTRVPELQWMKAGENIAINSSKCSASGNINTCNLTMKAELQMEGNSYVCQTTQSSTKNYNCTSDVIIYAFGNYPELRRTINDKVNCSFNSSSQSCTSSWIFYNGTTNWTESQERDMEFKRPGRYICEAICVIRNSNCTFTAMAVDVTAAEEPQGSTDDRNPVVPIVVPIVVASVIATIIIVVALIILFNRRKKERQNGQRHSEQTLHMLPDDFEISFIRNIESMEDDNSNKRVRGLAILNDELFVAFENSGTIEICPIDDIQASKRSDDIQASKRSLMVKDLSDPGTIAACAKNDCLYIMDHRKRIPDKKIFKVKSDGTIVKIWLTDKGDRGRISVSHDGCVVMTVYDIPKVKIYSSDGELLKTINLLKTSIGYVYHAIYLADRNFILCHGMRDEESKFHGLCKIDRKGKVLQAFGNDRGSDHLHLNSPVYLIERNDGSILVADQGNHRIILLNSKFDFLKELCTKASCNINLPEAMCIYEETTPARLFLGCNTASNSGGYVLDFKLSQSKG